MAFDPKHLAKTKRFMSSMELKTAGWKLETHNADMDEHPRIFLYAFDHLTGWTWMCTVPRDVFITVSKRAHADKAHVQEWRDGTGEIIGTIAEKRAISPVNDMDWEAQLGLCIASYAGTTKVWELAKMLERGGHFFVLDYRKKGAKDHLLRPFAMEDTSNNVLPAGEVKTLIEKVIAVDKQNHPDWFN